MSFYAIFCFAFTSLQSQQVPLQQEEWEKTNPAKYYSYIMNTLNNENNDYNSKNIRDNLSLSIAAAWNKCYLCTKETQLVEHKYISYRTDPIALSRFIGYVEGKFNINAPTIWEKCLKTGKLLPDRSKFEFELESKSTNTNVHNFLPGIEGKMKINGKYVISEFDHFKFTKYSFIEYDSVIYITLFGWPAERSGIFAFDKISGNQLWTAKVWAMHGLREFSGMGNHTVELVHNQNDIILFGSSNDSLYVESFDAKSGAAKSKFCTFLTMYRKK